MKGILKYLAAMLLCMLPLTAKAAEFDMDEYLYGHVGDSYEWHITTVNGKDIAIPLPVIVFSRSGNGAACFMSSKLSEGGEYRGYSIAGEDSEYNGKIVEKSPDGSEIRPVDLSITKNVLGLMINCAILLVLVLSTTKWYRKHDALKEAPTGVSGIMEMLVTMVEMDIIRPCVGPDYRRYSPYLLTAFFFILINNLMGIVPFFPGGANVTGNIAVTFVLAMCTFVAVNVFGNRHYWKDILWPDEGPATSYAIDRNHRNIYQAVQLDGQALCQYSCRTFHDTWRGGRNFPYCGNGTARQRRTERYRHIDRRFYGYIGIARCFCPGVCVHYAFSGVHRPFKTETRKRINNLSYNSYVTFYNSSSSSRYSFFGKTRCSYWRRYCCFCCSIRNR